MRISRAARPSSPRSCRHAWQPWTSSGRWHWPTRTRGWDSPDSPAGLFALRAQDRGLNDALAEWVAADSEIVREACQRGLDLAEKIIERARLDGRLRSDFTSADLSTIGRAMAHVINESTEATAFEWRRCLTFFLDGLRAHPADTDSPATAGHPL